MGLLTSLFALQKRSLENPSTPLSAPDDWLFDSLGSFRASSGVNVNRETALTYDAYWRCVSLISGDVGKTPLHVQVKEDDAWLHDEDHPAYYLLCHEANPEVSSVQWKRVMAVHGCAEGNGYSYIMRDGAGRPRELWPLSPMKTYPVRQPGDNEIWYVTEVAAAQRKIPAADIFHLKGLSFDGLVGYSVVSKMREALGLALAYENYASIFFRNNARPNVVLRHPGRLKPEAKINLRESWERIHSGLENSHRTAVLEEGMDLATFVVNARDSQLLEGMQFSKVKIANFFGVPPHKVGDSSRTSYNSLEQENQEYLADGAGLGFWLAAFQDEARKKLLTEEERHEASHRVRFHTKDLIRANLQTRTAYYVSGLQNGWLCPDEVRAEEGLNPRPDGKGKDFLQALNMGKPGGTPPPQGKAIPAAGPPKLPPPQRLLLPPPGRAATKVQSVLIPVDKFSKAEARKWCTDHDFKAGAPDETENFYRFRQFAPGKCSSDPRTITLDKDNGIKAVICQTKRCRAAGQAEANRGLVADVVTRMARRLGHAARRAADNPGGYVQWVEQGLAADHADVVREAFTPVLRAAAPGLWAEGVVLDFLGRCRADLLALADQCTPRQLAGFVETTASRWQGEGARDLARALTERRAVDQPGRTVAQALAILEQIPERRPGQILPPFPVNQHPPYLMTAEKLRALWEADKIAKTVVKLRELIAIQDWCFKEKLIGWIKDPDKRPKEHIDVEGSLDDLPYVVDCDGQLYIYDGTHRLSARFLLAMARTRAYLIREKDIAGLPPFGD